LYLADINAVNKRDGFTPLYYAALSENKEITERLLKMGANIHKRMGQQMTALQVALRFNKLVSIELIIEYLINKHSSSSENLVNFLKSLKDGKLTAQSLAKRASQLEDLNEVLNSVEEAKTFLAFLELDENKLKAFFQNRIKETKFKDIFIDACCEINSIHWMYQINPVHFKKSFTPIELPKEEPEAKLGELTTLFDRVHKVSDQLHMENNPELRETELLNREALKKGLEEFIGKIQDSAAIIGAPRADNVEALQAFWRKNRIMAKLLIERISESLNEVERASQNQAEHARLEDTISQLMDCIVCFSEAGSYCATRINQALSRHYCIFFLSDEEKENQMSPFEKKVFDSANQLKLKAIDKVSNGDVHTLNAIHYFLGNELGIHSAAAYFDQLVMGSEEFNREFKERLRLHLSSYINVKSYAEYFYKKMNSDEYKWMELIEILTLRHYEKKPERFLDDSDEESLVPKLTPYAALEILTHLDIFVSEQ
ncbi:MAG: ankyrin repeat domain-containing protein, partial [Waddliaceae bacterium]